LRNSPSPIVFALAGTRVVRLLKLVTAFCSMVRGWSLAATRRVWAFHSSIFFARDIGNNHLDDAWGIRNFESMNTGKLRIGNNWNAITIIALSQNNPMKAIAEFVENSIDAGAKTVTVVRGREKGEHYLKVIDDGAGIPLDAEGISDFKKELVIKYFSGFPVDTMLERIDELTLYTEENLR
jgi:hypothetical protein